METTFISIQSLDEDARILYTSDSVVDVLGYTPDEVVNHSAWSFFAEADMPYARQFHRKRVEADKAAVLAYVRIRDKHGQWIGCECCFTIVYDVMIVCVSVYRQGLSSQKRALEAPMVRRIFTSSPRDPRYHMLSHISAKFSAPASEQQNEPRAALFLNRFTRTLTVMYATTGIQDIVGIPAEAMRGRSFYYCIAENCVSDAIKCLENAKANDSLAYLRFWFRDPRQDDEPPPENESEDEEMTTEASFLETDEDESHLTGTSAATSSSAMGGAEVEMNIDGDNERQPVSRNSSGDSTAEVDTHEGIFGHPPTAESSSSSVPTSPERTPNDPIELEAVISCTSDGLVVCLRKARPLIPHPTHRPSKPVYERGLFAAPWATEPVLPPIETRAGAGFGTAFAPALGPHGAHHPAASPPRAKVAAEQSDFMSAIREQAVFAWGLTGINGSLAEFGRGKPLGESLPRDGLPVWASDPRRAETSKSGAHIFGDPGLGRGGGNNGGSSGGSSSAGRSNGPPSANGTPF